MAMLTGPMATASMSAFMSSFATSLKPFTPPAGMPSVQDVALQVVPVLPA